ncbi:MAG TPA: response regulator [Polyangiaceae bacterium]|jgi:CheY-like chemotaxis protein|nr:response regulator [Polyangiaceae bacterium]
MGVLIVDDEPGLCESLRDFLEDEGYAVSTAANGAEALHLLEGAELPCIMILDLIMPVVTGNEVYDTVRKDPRLANIPIVVSTSDPSRAPAGAVIMKKPINLERLLGAVRSHCHVPSAR